MKSAHIFISGYVQGIGFRQFIKWNANKIRVTGWVRNLSDGRVEAVFQGRKEDIEKLIFLCKKGPFLADIKQVDVKWEDTKENFEVFETIV